jgi:hypothetical protein
MPNPVEIENIEVMRRLQGIDDAPLRQAIGRLKVGDFVNLTLLTATKSFETLAVRITSIKGSAFRGKLAGKPTSAGLAKLRVGSPLVFSTTHIHSLAKDVPAEE